MTHLTCDEEGIVRGFSYHDGFLDGILANTEGTEIYLPLRSSGGERRVLTLRGVEALHVEAFREGNVVLNLRLLPATRIAIDDEVQAMLTERLFLDPAKLNQHARVFLLESSYGADVLAVCHEAEISKVGQMIVLSGE